MDLILRNATLRGKNDTYDIAIQAGTIQKIGQNLSVKADREINVKGKLVTSPFVESHVHLDSALTVGNPRFNESGTLLEAIEIWGEYKQTLTEESLINNALTAIDWLIANGVLHIRTHVDSTESSLMTLTALLKVKEKVKDAVDLQIVAFPQDGIFAENGMDERLEQAVKLGADVIGGLPQSEYTREDGIRSIDYIFQLAKKYQKKIDIHTDETADEHSRFLEVIAKYAIESGMKHAVTASHTTALHNYHNDYAARVIQLVKRANINIVTNPFSNALLQNRLDGYPRHRGTTRVDELLLNGVNVSIGNDNIMDPFGPLGKGNLLQAAHLLAHTAHLSSKSQLQQLFDMITINGARTLGIEDTYGIEVGKPADCIVLDAKNEVEALRLTSECLYVIRKGNIIAKSTPAERTVLMSNKWESIDFKL